MVFFGGYRKIGKKWFAFLWDRKGNVLAKKEVDPTPSPLLQAIAKNQGKFKGNEKIQGMSITVPLLGDDGIHP